MEDLGWLHTIIFAYHIGNNIEPWIEKYFLINLKTEMKTYNNFEMFRVLKENSFNYFFY